MIGFIQHLPIKYGTYRSCYYNDIHDHYILDLSDQDNIGSVNLNSEVSSFQRLLSRQMWHLRQMKVSCL